MGLNRETAFQIEGGVSPRYVVSHCHREDGFIILELSNSSTVQRLPLNSLPFMPKSFRKHHHGHRYVPMHVKLPRAAGSCLRAACRTRRESPARVAPLSCRSGMAKKKPEIVSGAVLGAHAGHQGLHEQTHAHENCLTCPNT